MRRKDCWILCTVSGTLEFIGRAVQGHESEDTKIWRSSFQGWIAVPCYPDITLVGKWAGRVRYLGRQGRLLARSTGAAQAIFPYGSSLVPLALFSLSCPMVVIWAGAESSTLPQSPPSSPFPPNSAAVLVMNWAILASWTLFSFFFSC